MTIFVMQPPVENQNIACQLIRNKVSCDRCQLLRMWKFSRCKDYPATKLADIGKCIRLNEFLSHFCQSIFCDGKAKFCRQLRRDPLTNLAASTSTLAFDKVNRSVVAAANKWFCYALLRPPEDFVNEDGCCIHRRQLSDLYLAMIALFMACPLHHVKGRIRRNCEIRSLFMI